MYKSKSYKVLEDNLGKHECSVLGLSTEKEPCWGEVGYDEDWEDNLIYTCQAHDELFTATGRIYIPEKL